MPNNTFEPGTVISGTLRASELIPAFFELLQSQNPDIARDLLLEFDIRGPWFDEEHDFWFMEDAMELLDRLFDELDERAPDGYYFGVHPGDGTDFGYWECDVEEC